ncbi:acetate uptake transporter [Methanolobus sp.]|jgi:succinate-acetate transporter protein|uniref:acetate uptake transporter n=1 Tax=Methanolobus sp. TaxID=1874737 RepID=UPI0025CF1C2D|nr:acetate uptake transporter [Methanolobus sp.]
MEGEVTIKDTTAGSPAAVGFYGLGFAATFAGLLNMGMIPDALMVIAMAITLGGLAEVLAGIQLFKKGDTFGATAFTIFGFWWLGFAYINLAPAGLFNAPMAAASATSMGFFTLVWGIIATLLTIATFKIGVKMITVVFIVLDLTFFSLALVFFGILPLGIAGLITLITGLASLYLATALVMNAVGMKMPI